MWGGGGGGGVVGREIVFRVARGSCNGGSGSAPAAEPLLSLHHPSLLAPTLFPSITTFPNLCYLLPPPPPPPCHHLPIAPLPPHREGPGVRTLFCYSGWTQRVWFAYKSGARLLRLCSPPQTIPPLSPSPSHLSPSSPLKL